MKRREQKRDRDIWEILNAVLGFHINVYEAKILIYSLIQIDQLFYTLFFRSARCFISFFYFYFVCTKKQDANAKEYIKIKFYSNRNKYCYFSSLFYLSIIKRPETILCLFSSSLFSSFSVSDYWEIDDDFSNKFNKISTNHETIYN